MDEKADATLDSSVQPGPFGANQGRSGGGAILLLTLFVAAPAMASALQEGDFVREGRSCAKAGDRDRLTSNGHAVSPPGQHCRVVSRTESGGYYPIFNQSCTDGAGEVSRVDLLVSAPDRIALRERAGGTTVAYRHCPLRAIPRGEH